MRKYPQNQEQDAADIIARLKLQNERLKNNLYEKQKSQYSGSSSSKGSRSYQQNQRAEDFQFQFDNRSKQSKYTEKSSNTWKNPQNQFKKFKGQEKPFYEKTQYDKNSNYSKQFSFGDSQSNTYISSYKSNINQQRQNYQNWKREQEKQAKKNIQQDIKSQYSKKSSNFTDIQFNKHQNSQIQTNNLSPCYKCGAWIKTTDKFCSKCGNKAFQTQQDKQKSLDFTHLKGHLIQSVKAQNIDGWAWAGPNQGRRNSYASLFSKYKNTAVKDIQKVFETRKDINQIKEQILKKISGQYADIWAIAGPDQYHRGNMAKYWNKIKADGVARLTKIFSQ